MTHSTSAETPSHPKKNKDCDTSRGVTLLFVLLGAAWAGVNSGCLRVLSDITLDTEVAPDMTTGSNNPQDGGTKLEPAPASEPALGGCVPEEVRCHKNWLQKCGSAGDAGLQQWDLIAECTTGTSCSTTLEQCTDEPCTDGSWQCSEGRFTACVGGEGQWLEREQCDSQRQCLRGLEQCATAGCDATRPPQCPRDGCTPGEFSCFGDGILNECSADQRWLERDQCASISLCLAATGSQCEPPTCQLGEMRCTGQTLEMCNSALTGFDMTICGLGETCNAATGTCDTQQCALGTFTCVGNYLRSCNVETNTYRTIEECDSTALCNSAQARCDLPAGNAPMPSPPMPSPPATP